MCFCQCGSRTGDKKTLQGKLTGACWTSFSKNNVWAGFLPTCLGMIYYQQEGNKSLSMAQFPQVLEVVLADLWDVWAWLTGLQRKKSGSVAAHSSKASRSKYVLVLVLSCCIAMRQVKRNIDKQEVSEGSASGEDRTLMDTIAWFQNLTPEVVACFI